MNDYTHSGILQLGNQFSSDHKIVKPSYDSEAVIEILGHINMILLLVTALLFSVFNKMDKLNQVEHLISEYIGRRKQ